MAVTLLPALLPLPLLVPSWLDPAQIIAGLGPFALWGVAVIVLVESGLFTALPGDSLLFTIGMLVGATSVPQPLWLVWLVLTGAAIAGNAAGYLLGRAVGPRLFRPRPGLAGRVFAPAHLIRAQAFFDHHGPRALVLARFVPVIRTVITLAAGIAGMPARRFLTFSAVGGALWVVGVTVLGYYLGQLDYVRTHIDAVLMVIVAVSLLPMLVATLRERAAARRQPASAGNAR